ncbi:hypothetical protein F3Y22_tig00111095pilonHSYRG00085 [Hibiscus syriacus]|uniref:Uncharacterized protein n=1 Tax=Hibiscus syriacus TaxID=106335 RepID=A0A6A2Z1Y1_HIBSY|nr:hypothetical protein F3Y22_tig00111095pilonHSYRG00085 [Hibiscus syriacus]
MKIFYSDIAGGFIGGSYGGCRLVEKGGGLRLGEKGGGKLDLDRWMGPDRTVQRAAAASYTLG